MKIVLATNGYPPQRWAGTETYTAGIAGELQRRGHDVRVLCAGVWDQGPRACNGFDDQTHEGVRVRRLNLNWTAAPDPFRRLYDNPTTARLFGDLLAAEPPDVVHVTSCETLSAAVVGVAKRAGLPVVLSLTDFWFLCPRINLVRSDGEACDGRVTPWDCLRCQLRRTAWFRRAEATLPPPAVRAAANLVARLPVLARRPGLRGMAGDMAARRAFLRAALAQADLRITASTFVRGVFEACGVTDPIHVTPYGHDLAWLAGYTGKTPAPALRIGFIGQVARTKGVHVLLEALRLLSPDHARRIHAVIYGRVDAASPYAAELAALAQGLPHVDCRGTYRHEDSAAVYAGLDVLAVPSLWHDFPLVMHEAFATGTPVIATELGGMAEAVAHGVNGLLFPRGDAAALARQLQRLLDEPALLPSLRAGIRPVRTIADEVTELESHYRRLAAAPVPA